MSENPSALVGEGILDRIRYRPSGYKPIGGRIAAAILEDPDRFTRMPVVEFAHRTAVSTGSVVRFAQLLGFRGYSDLKLAVARDVPAASAADRGSPTSAFQQHMDEQMRMLRRAAETVDPLAATRAAARIASATHVEIVATGSSASIAHAMVFSLTVLGVRARHLPDSGEHAAAAAMLAPDDLLVAISLSGRTRSTVDAARKAREAGSSVVAFTANPRAPLLAPSDVRVLFDAQVANLFGEWTARTALYAVVRAVLLEVADYLPAEELSRRRGKWSSGRFDLRYGDA